MSKSIYVVAVCCLLPVPLVSQSHPSAEGGPGSIRVGVSFSTFNPDYGCSSNSPLTCWQNHVMGFAPYLATRPILFDRIGAEGQARFLVWHGPTGLTETSYMAGPDVRAARFGALSLSAKLLLGVGRFSVPAPQIGTGSYFAYAPGGVADYRMARRVTARIDYEYQRWPSFSGLNGKHGLTPNGLSVGISYAIF